MDEACSVWVCVCILYKGNAFIIVYSVQVYARWFRCIYRRIDDEWCFGIGALSRYCIRICRRQLVAMMDAHINRFTHISGEGKFLYSVDAIDIVRSRNMRLHETPHRNRWNVRKKAKAKAWIRSKKKFQQKEIYRENKYVFLAFDWISARLTSKMSDFFASKKREDVINKWVCRAHCW